MADVEAEMVIVTGAGSGMGRAIALDQAAQGRHVVLVGRRREPLEETASMAADGASCTVVAADTSTLEGVQALVEAVGRREVVGFAAVAGGQGEFKNPPSSVEGVDEAWTQALRKNLFSAVLPIEAVLRSMAEQRGRILLISSTSGLDGRGGPYATAKAALAGYGRDLAVRAGKRGVTANTIAPGFVADTGFLDAGGYQRSQQMLDAVTAQTLVGRVGRSADVTAAARWLLDPDAGWVTGQTVVGGTEMAR